jgi:hypothetical protein
MATNLKTRTKKEKKTGKRDAHTNFLRICNLVPSKGTETDWKYEDALASGALGAVAALPASVDLRQGWPGTDGILRWLGFRRWRCALPHG